MQTYLKIVTKSVCVQCSPFWLKVGWHVYFFHRKCIVGLDMLLKNFLPNLTRLENVTNTVGIEFGILYLIFRKLYNSQFSVANLRLLLLKVPQVSVGGPNEEQTISDLWGRFVLRF